MRDSFSSTGFRTNGLTPLVGRKAELDAIQCLVEPVVQGHGRILFVTGDPGVGKTRLIWEARQRYFDRLAQWEAPCLSHTPAIPYDPFQRLLRNLFAVDPADAADTARRKIEEGLPRHPDLDFSTRLNHLLAVIGYPLPSERTIPPAQWRRQTHRTVIELIRCAARQRPICLILDDIHQADDSSKALLDELMEEVHQMPLLLCLTARGDPWNTLNAQRPNVTPIHLDSLSIQEAEQLLGELVKSDCLSDCFRQVFFGKTHFSPLFIEEVVRKMISEEILIHGENGWVINGNRSKEIIPENLIETIQSRLARLDESTRRVLQSGAVLGREFTGELLELLEQTRDGLQERLATLQGMGFLAEEQNGNGLLFAFHHALTQEAVYNSLQQRHKQRLHARVVKAILALYGKDSEPHYPALTYHALQGEMPDLALVYLERLAQRARRQHACHEALEHYDVMLGTLTRLSHLPDGGERILGVLLAQAEIHLLLGETDEARQDVEQAFAVAQEISHRGWIAKACLAQAFWASSVGDYETAEKVLEGGRSILDGLEDAELEMKYWNLKGISAWKQGDFARAEKALNKGIEWAEAAQAPFYASNAYNNLGLLAGNQGKSDEALRYHRQALRLRREAGDEMGLAATHNNLGIIYENTGNYRMAREHYGRALRLAQRTAYREVETAVLANLGQLAEFQNQLAEALDYNARSLESARRTGDVRSEAIARDNLGNVHYALRRWADAESAHQEALRLAESIGDKDVTARALLGLCFARTQQGQGDDAEIAWDQASRLIESMGLNEARPRLHRARATCLLERGERAEAGRQLQVALQAAQQFSQPMERDKATRLLDQLNE